MLIAVYTNLVPHWLNGVVILPIIYVLLSLCFMVFATKRIFSKNGGLLRIPSRLVAGVLLAAAFIIFLLGLFGIWVGLLSTSSGTSVGTLKGTVPASSTPIPTRTTATPTPTQSPVTATPGPSSGTSIGGGVSSNVNGGSESGGAIVYYANCSAARAAGAAPIRAGEPGYRPALDRDGDGIACE